MSILHRKVDETILFQFPGMAEQVRVTVLRTTGGRVKLGIEAPREVDVIRGELTNVVSLPESETAHE